MRHCATSRKVAGSIPDGVIGNFYGHNPSDRNMALRSTQPLKYMSSKNTLLVVKGGRCVRLTTLPPSRADCLEIWEPQPPGTLWCCPGIALTFCVLQGGAKRTHVFDICLRFLSLGFTTNQNSTFENLVQSTI